LRAGRWRMRRCLSRQPTGCSPSQPTRSTRCPPPHPALGRSRHPLACACCVSPRQGDGKREGNLYFELNKMLRLRGQVVLPLAGSCVWQQRTVSRRCLERARCRRCNVGRLHALSDDRAGRAARRGSHLLSWVCTSADGRAASGVTFHVRADIPIRRQCCACIVGDGPSRSTVRSLAQHSRCARRHRVLVLSGAPSQAHRPTSKPPNASQTGKQGLSLRSACSQVATSVSTRFSLPSLKFCCRPTTGS
jgi:hypothetical protein